MIAKRIVFLAGPTAVGKSEIALHLASRIHAEIISADSMQVYKEVAVLNNKPSNAFLGQVPHHLIGVVSVKKEFDVMQFLKQSKKAIEDIHRRGKIPLIVGGTGLYIMALLDGIFEGAPKNESLRLKLTKVAEEKGGDFLYEKLKTLDPQAASKIHPNDLRRVIRALEVCMTESAPMSQLQKDRKGLCGSYDIRMFFLNRERILLNKIIDDRVDEMFEAGAVAEVDKLAALNLSQTASKIIGINEIRQFNEGKMTLEEAKDIIKRHTRQYAKRQLTWFRKDKRFLWITIFPSDTVESITRTIKSKLN